MSESTFVPTEFYDGLHYDGKPINFSFLLYLKRELAQS